MKSEETMAKDHEPKREELSADAKPFRPGQDIQTPNQRYVRIDEGIKERDQA